jgi:hypothetical protein
VRKPKPKPPTPKPPTPKPPTPKPPTPKPAVPAKKVPDKVLPDFDYGDAVDVKIAKSKELQEVVDKVLESGDAINKKLGEAVLERDVIKGEMEELAERIKSTRDTVRKLTDVDESMPFYDALDEMYRDMEQLEARRQSHEININVMVQRQNDKVHEAISLSKEEQVFFRASHEDGRERLVSDRGREAESFLRTMVKQRDDYKRVPPVRLKMIAREAIEDEQRAYYLGEFKQVWDRHGNVQRAHKAPEVFVTHRSPVRTYVHEYGHHLESTLEGAEELANEFRDYRIKKAGTSDVSLKKQFPKSKYGEDEFGNPDDWEKAFGNSAYYIGKKYANNATEVISMGIEKVYADPVGFARHDPEYFKFIIGVMRGILK